MSTLQEIEAAALRLSQKDRLYLPDKILGSLAPSPDAAEPDEILAKVIRRDAELEIGKATPLTEDAFWARARPRNI
jgi:putative addiction module component (TIGR02574 family)